MPHLKRKPAVRAWKCRTVRVLIPGDRPADVQLCPLSRTEYDGYFGDYDFHVRREAGTWGAAVFQRRVKDPDAALRQTVDGDSLLGTVAEVVRWVRERRGP